MDNRYEQGSVEARSVTKALLELSGEEWLLRRKGLCQELSRRSTGLSSPEEQFLKHKNFRIHENDMQVNESLLTLGNGYLNIRGSLEELPPGNCGGMYLSGIYDKSEADVEQLVKCPMWTDVSVWSGPYKFCIPICKALSHEQILDMKKGILHRISTFENPSGKILSIETVRLVFMHDVHLGYMMVKLTPINFSGPIRVLSGLNGDVCNSGYFPREMLKHLQLECLERGRVFMYLQMKTREQGIRISEAVSWKLVSPLFQQQTWEPRIYGEKFTSEISLFVPVCSSSVSDFCPYPSCLCLPLHTSFSRCPLSFRAIVRIRGHGKS